MLEQEVFIKPLGIQEQCFAQRVQSWLIKKSLLADAGVELVNGLASLEKGAIGAIALAPGHDQPRCGADNSSQEGQDQERPDSDRGSMPAYELGCPIGRRVTMRPHGQPFQVPVYVVSELLSRGISTVRLLPQGHEDDRVQVTGQHPLEPLRRLTAPPWQSRRAWETTAWSPRPAQAPATTQASESG